MNWRPSIQFPAGPISKTKFSKLCPQKKRFFDIVGCNKLLLLATYSSLLRVVIPSSWNNFLPDSVSLFSPTFGNVKCVVKFGVQFFLIWSDHLIGLRPLCRLPLTLPVTISSSCKKLVEYFSKKKIRNKALVSKHSTVITTTQTYFSSTA